MFGLFKKKFDFDTYVAASIEGMRLATSGHTGIWNLGTEQSWNVNQDAGTIVFTFQDGTTASAPVQIIGTLNAADSTFLWAWDHPSIEPALQINASRVKAFGEEHGLDELTTRKVACNEARAWEYTAVAMRLAEANGGYRAEASPGTFVFMNFGEISLAKKI